MIKTEQNLPQNEPLTKTDFNGSFTIQDMIGFADWCRNGMTNLEDSTARINEYLETWILQHKNL